MRPGVNVAELASPTSVDVTVEIRRGRVTLASSVPVDLLQIEAQSARDVPAQLTFTAPLEWIPTDPMSPLAPYGQQAHVTIIMNGYPTSLGWWRLTSWTSDTSSVKVTCSDLLWLAAHSDMERPSSPSGWATYKSELERLSLLPVVFDHGVRDKPCPRHFQWGVKRLEAIQTLTESLKAGYRVGADGALHVYPLTPKRSLDALYQATDLLLDSSRSSGDTIPNVVVVAAENDGNMWVGRAEHTAPPFEPDIYGRVVQRHTMNIASTDRATQLAAATYMDKIQTRRDTRTLSIVPDPRIELGDFIGARMPDGHLYAGRVTAYSLPVWPLHNAMRVDLEEVP